MLDTVLGTEGRAVNKAAKMPFLRGAYLPRGREAINKLKSMPDENSLHGENQSREGRMVLAT